MVQNPAPLATRLRQGSVRHAAWLALRDPLAAEAVARSGVDLVVFDQQHGAVGVADLIGLLQAVQPFVPALVRTESGYPSLVSRVLDLGADGVIVPLVDGPADARRLVDSALYPPAGRRSFGPVRAGLRHGPGYRQRVAEHAAVIVMIETAAGLAAVEEIAATPGLAGLFVGPADLGSALGVGPQTDGDDPAYLAARRRVVAAAHAHGLSVGLYGNDTAAQRVALADGIDWVVVVHDLPLLSQGTRERLRAMDPGRPARVQ